jgi:PAS domain S-box-containing protein
MEAPEILQIKRALKSAIAQTIVLTLITGVLFLFTTNVWLNSSIENFKTRQRNFLIQYVKMARSAIDPIIEQLNAGEITQKEAITEVRDTVRRLTYVDEYGNNYIFMSSYEGIMLVQPFEPHLELSDMWNLRDINGVYIIRELVRSAIQHPDGGFVSYYYYPPDSNEPEEKLSYVVGIPELNAYIGTGTYMGKFYAQQEKLIAQVRWLLFSVLALSGGLALLTIRRLYLNNSQLVQEINERKKAQAAVELSMRNLQKIFDGTYDAIFVHDYKGKILEANQRMQQLFGINHEQVLQTTVRNLSCPPDIQKYSVDDILNQVQTGKELLFEWKFIRLSDNHPFDAEVGLRPIIWQGKESVLAVVRDISERKEIELERQKNQHAIEHSQALAHVGHFFYDIETHILTWSKELYRIYGLDPSMPPPSEEEQRLMIHSEDWERVNEAKMYALHSGEAVNVEYRIHRPDGSLRYLNLMMDWDRNEDGVIVSLNGTIQDITRQREYEEVLRSSEEKFRSVVDQLSEGFMLVDEDATITTWNRALEKISGLARETVLGCKSWDIQAKLSSQNDQSKGTLSRIKSITLQALQEGKSIYFQPEGFIFPYQQGNIQKTILQTAFPVVTRHGYRIGSLFRDITDLKRSQEQVQREVQKLNALHEIDTRIVNQDSLTDILESIGEQACNLLKADAVLFLLLEHETQQLKIAASLGFKTDVNTYPHLITSDCYPWRALEKGKLLYSTEDEECHECDCFKNEGFKASYSFPIITNRQAKGVIELFTYEPLQIDAEWSEFMEILAGQTAIAMEKTGLFHELQASNTELNLAYEATIAGWSRALELRDKETRGHSERVMHLACELAQKLGYSTKDMQHFRRGVLLHDIGKMGVPDNILLKPSPLTEDEWQIMRMHPDFAYQLLADIPYLRPALEIPYCHHERWDGSGYPRGLKGEEIPLSARIFAVVDVWDALISDRPYRPGWTHAATRQYLLQNAGVTFDPEVIKVFLDMI